MYKQILKIKLILQQFVHPFLLSYLGNACHFESHTTSVCSRFPYLSQVFASNLNLNADIQKNKLVKENLQHKKLALEKIQICIVFQTFISFVIYASSNTLNTFQ